MKHHLITVLAMALLALSSCGSAISDHSMDELEYSRHASVFHLWSPSAQAVRLNIYDAGQGDAPAASVTDMKLGKDGRWNAKLKGDLVGKFYTFSVMVEGEWLQETPGINAKAIGLNGKRAAIIDMAATDPQGWESDKSPALNSFADIFIYEVHHRDFSVDPDGGMEHKGKFLAFTETGTKSPQGYSTGIDHLKELGVTHVHILPSFSNSADETSDRYNWGYNPRNYNAVAGQYSTDPSDPTCRIREFKQMVMAMHQAGLRVVLDVVYNHTSNTKDSNFELTAPGYFYRHTPEGKHSNGSGCGNETASEREMMRRYMIESVLYWVKEYHIDGFRFDLMGCHDIETMNQIRAALDAVDPSIFVYGEGWHASACQLDDSVLALKANVSQMPGIAVFSDEMRDAVRGPWSSDKVGAFLIGDPGHEESIKFGLAGAIEHPQVDYSKVNYVKEPWALSPLQMISYVSCHDDMCMHDRLVETMPEASEELRIRAHKLAEAIALTSQGIPFIYAGEELNRDKHQVHDSYRSPDSVNAVRWANKSTYNGLFTFIRDLARMRREHPAFRMGDAELIRQHMDFLPVEEDNLVAFHLDGKAVGDSWSSIIVAFNGNPDKPVVLDVPENDYVVVCHDGETDLDGLRTARGSQVSIPAESALIMFAK